MEKNITLSQSKTGCGRTSSELAGTAFRPFERLRRYYSDVLEEEVSYSRMWRLINAQLAFVAAVFPADAPCESVVRGVARLLAPRVPPVRPYLSAAQSSPRAGRDGQRVSPGGQQPAEAAHSLFGVPPMTNSMRPPAAMSS